MMPFIADGHYELEIPILALEQTLKKNIVNLQVNDPQSVIDNFATHTQNHVSQLESMKQNGAQIEAQDIQALKDMRTGTNNMISDLSAQGKQRLAVLIKANVDNLSLSSLAVTDSFMLKSTSTAAYPSIQWEEMGAKLITNPAMSTGK